MKVSASTARPTFRDPAGSLRIVGDRVLRTVHPEFAEDCLSFLQSETAHEWIASGKLVDTRILYQTPGRRLELEHKRVAFPSYPWEWTPGQWISAAELTLDFAEQQIAIGRVLKDATPLNILFEGSRPVFVDVLSTESRDLNDPLWLAYGQFVRTFLLPLAALKYLGWPLTSSLTRRDGYEPNQLYPHLSAFRRSLPPLLSLVTIPNLFQHHGGASSSHKMRQHPEVAASLHRRRLRKLRRVVREVAPKLGGSRWSRYPETADHYAQADRAQKVAFLKSALANSRSRYVLDIGANTGEYSRLAAQSGANVVALDTDVCAAEINWQLAASGNLPILPLVSDIARPTPALGWRNSESASLLDRARGRFDCVMMLGVIHHLLLVDQIPLPEIAQLLAEFTTKFAIVEWVPASDLRFRDLCCGRDALYGHLDESVFLQSFSQVFSTVLRQPLNNGRVLFMFERNT